MYTGDSYLPFDSIILTPLYTNHGESDRANVDFAVYSNHVARPAEVSWSRFCPSKSDHKVVLRFLGGGIGFGFGSFEGDYSDRVRDTDGGYYGGEEMTSSRDNEMQGDPRMAQPDNGRREDQQNLIDKVLHNLSDDFSLSSRSGRSINLANLISPGFTVTMGDPRYGTGGSPAMTPLKTSPRNHCARSSQAMGIIQCLRSRGQRKRKIGIGILCLYLS